MLWMIEMIDLPRVSKGQLFPPLLVQSLLPNEIHSYPSCWPPTQGSHWSVGLYMHNSSGQCSYISDNSKPNTLFSPFYCTVYTICSPDS
jgi:hypothetical protein